MMTIDPTRYAAMLAADTAGDTATADRLATQLACDERRNDAAARNRALVGRPVPSRISRPRGPMGEAS